VVADLRQLWLMLHVHMEDVNKLKVGQEVQFSLEGAKGDVPPARLGGISAEVDAKTRTVDVRADVPNPQGRLRPQNFGNARIFLGRVTRVVVPTEALQWDGRAHLVFVKGDSPTEFQPVRVRPGARHGDFTELLYGVTAGQEVATAGSHVLLSEMLKERISGEE
jgi:membrane fusion protein, heavy metal efflux system